MSKKERPIESLHVTFTIIDLDDNEHTCFECNIPNDLREMAKACGVYESLLLAEKAGSLSKCLLQDFRVLTITPSVFKMYHTENNEEAYRSLIDVVFYTLEASLKYPSSIVSTWYKY